MDSFTPCINYINPNIFLFLYNITNCSSLILNESFIFHNIDNYQLQNQLPNIFFWNLSYENNIKLINSTSNYGDNNGPPNIYFIVVMSIMCLIGTIGLLYIIIGSLFDKITYMKCFRKMKIHSIERL